eukprot:14026751-Alexandrium_andersonii.AAC.1
MSASLVGSEMCIRDSWRAPESPRRALVSSGGPETGSKSHGRWPRGSGIWAVSYTHLTLPTICSV